MTHNDLRGEFEEPMGTATLPSGFPLVLVDKQDRRQLVSRVNNKTLKCTRESDRNGRRCSFGRERFTSVADPVGAGFVKNMARPGGNTTGFIQFEYTLSGKWMELLGEIAPSVTRVAVLRDPAITSGISQFAVIQSVAPSVRVEVSAINMRDAGEIESDIADFARTPNGGLIVTASALTAVHGKLIIALATRHRLPAVYYRRGYVAVGGLISYGYDLVDQYRGAAGYVDRILKGQKPANLPGQAPTRYELVINLKTAEALGLEVPPMLLARADEVIE
jgi:putative ABC transport system substrate-binding protein